MTTNPNGKNLVDDIGTINDVEKRWHDPQMFRAAVRYVVAVVVLAVLALFLTRSGIALDAVATMTWWQNWHLIAEGTSYWASSPSPLRHAWSLAE